MNLKDKGYFSQNILKSTHRVVSKKIIKNVYDYKTMHFKKVFAIQQAYLLVLVFHALLKVL